MEAEGCAVPIDLVSAMKSNTIQYLYGGNAVKQKCGDVATRAAASWFKHKLGMPAGARAVPHHLARDNTRV